MASWGRGGREEGVEIDQAHLAEFVDSALVDGDQEARMLEALAFAIGAIVLDHDFAQVGLHVSVGNLLFAIVTVAPLDGVDDAIETEKLANVLIALGGSIGMQDGEFLATRAVEEEIDGARWQFFEG